MKLRFLLILALIVQCQCQNITAPTDTSTTTTEAPEPTETEDVSVEETTTVQITTPPLPTTVKTVTTATTATTAKLTTPYPPLGWSDDNYEVYSPPKDSYEDRYGYNRDYDRDDYGRDDYGRDGYGRDDYGRDGYGRDNKNYRKNKYNDDDEYNDDDYKPSEYRSDRKKRVPDSYDNINLYFGQPSKTHKRKKMQRLRFPVHHFRKGNFPPLPPLLSFLPWLPIFHDKLTKQTIIFSPTGGLYIIPPVINFYGQLFSVAQLIASGYCSLVSTGAPPPPAINVAPLVQPGPVVGPGIPPPNPATGGFVGGVKTKFSNFKESHKSNTNYYTKPPPPPPPPPKSYSGY